VTGIHQTIAQHKTLGDETPCLLEQAPGLLVQALAIRAPVTRSLQLGLQTPQRIGIAREIGNLTVPAPRGRGGDM
jgi:hypothetical protein